VYISLINLCYGILFILGTIALIILIMVLIKLFSFLSRVEGLIKRNEKNVDEILISVPKATKNFLDLSDNLKAVGDVITETTANVIETKQHLEGYKDVFIDILKIATLVFTKKK